jgi:predicted Zn finger-like uncharacterized protein
MALATRCPHCATTFRVAADQLKLRGGIVRCGACQHIFDGNASLVDLDARAAAEPAHAPRAETAVPPSAPEAATAAQSEPQALPAGAANLGASPDPLGIPPGPQADSPPAPESAAGEPDAHADDIEVIDLAGQPDLPEAAEPEQSVTGPGAAEPPEDETIATTEGVSGQDDEAVTVWGEEALPVVETEAHFYPVLEAFAGDAHTPFAAEAAPTAQSAGEHKHVFSMGSALLSEPGQALPARETRIEPTLDLPDEELVAAPLPREQDEPVDALQERAATLSRFAGEHTPLPLRESAEGQVSPTPAAPAAAPPKPRSRLGRRSKLTPTRIAPPKLRVPEIDEPDFVKRGRQQERSGKRRRILMAAGSVVLALALLAQAATTFRNDLAARFPGMKPALTAVCALLGCRVELPARIENLAIETGDLQTLGNGTYILSTLLHNQALFAQAWPAIELALTDTNDKPLLRRVFTPAEYLPPGVAPAAGFAARTEQPVKLYFQLDQLKPSGYRIAVFYP